VLEALPDRTAAGGAGAVAVTALERAADLSATAASRAARRLRAAEVAAEIGRPAVSLALLRHQDMAALGPPGQARAMIVEELADFAPLRDSRRLSVLLSMSIQLGESGATDGAASLLWNAAAKCWRASATSA